MRSVNEQHPTERLPRGANLLVHAHLAALPSQQPGIAIQDFLNLLKSL